MAKRFIDTDLFRKPFMKGLEAPYKALWIYLLCECDHAGIWIVELDVAELRMGMPIDQEKVIEKMGGAVVPIDGGRRWFLPEFIAFQYGTLNPANRVHESVLTQLSKYGIDLEKKGLPSPLQGAKDKVKDKEKVKETPPARAREVVAVEDRKAAFIAACKAITDAQPDRLAKDQRQAFVDYWCEPSKTGKMRWEGEKYFDHGRRMDTWMANNHSRSNGRMPAKPEHTAERQDLKLTLD